jgi:hypothetical protein
VIGGVAAAVQVAAAGIEQPQVLLRRHAGLVKVAAA